MRPFFRNHLLNSTPGGVLLILLLFAGCTGSGEKFLSSDERGHEGSGRPGLASLIPPQGYQADPQGNQYPLLFVHGFAGWGPGELLGYRYWGGFNSLAEELTDAGYPSLVAAVGPFSSNWDRACELYAYIKGGRVDYGRVHAAKYGHQRFGRTFPGIYPQWDETRPLHLVGHSMGGQTLRQLIHLLEKGDELERAGTRAEDLSPLFEGGRSWVVSGTTISTPHDGTTLTDHVFSLLPRAQEWIARAGGGAGRNDLYDFKLDQWGLVRREGETLQEFTKRIDNSGLMEETRDICSWDLSRPGAEEFNRRVPASGEVYYFSVANQCTSPGLLTEYHYPQISMSPLFRGFARLMGREEEEAWRPNDGVVNTVSMAGPRRGSSDEIVPFDGIPRRGVWNSLGVQSGWDHMAITGHGPWRVIGLYIDLAKILHGLPQ